MHTPNGKTLGVLQKYPNLQQLYVLYCERRTASDGSVKFRRTLLEHIAMLQQRMESCARVVEVGPKQIPSSGVAFYFGGQMRSGYRLTAHEYIDALAGIAEQIPLECWSMLESMAGTLLKEKSLPQPFLGVK